MNNLTLFLFGLILFNFSNQSNADTCSCLWQGSFSKIANKADLVVSGKIINRKGNSIDLQINRTLLDQETKGKEFNQDIRIWLDNGKLCRPDMTRFAHNDHWLMALYKITTDEPNGFNPNTPNISFGRVNDYYLSKCGAFWLEVHEDFVSGNLVKGARWEWEDTKMNPVLLDLVDAFVRKAIPEKSLIEAAKPQLGTKKLMLETKLFLDKQ